MEPEEVLFVVAPALVSLVPTLAGILERTRARAGPGGVLAGMLISVPVVVLLVDSHARGVSTSDFILGLLLGTVFIGLLPAFLYYNLGQGMAGRLGWLALVWLLSQVPLWFYVFFLVIATLDLTHCPPDAYECPL